MAVTPDFDLSQTIEAINSKRQEYKQFFEPMYEVTEMKKKTKPTKPGKC